MFIKEMHMFKRLSPVYWLRIMYDWTLRQARTPQACWALFGVAFIESSVFPVPPDVLLVAMTTARRGKWFQYAAICTVGSVLGALLGYSIGFFLYETVGKWIINTYNLQEVMTVIGRKYNENAFFTVFTAAFTPIPYKAITIAAGVFRISLSMLLLASVIGRAGRFFIVSGAIRIFGARVQQTVEKYFDILSVVFIVLLVGGYLLLKHAFR